MRIMTGLGGDHDPRGFRNNRDTFTANQDICGNAAEFFRLCVKLARVAEGLNDGDARQSYKRTTFNFAIHRQPDQYRMIVERKGAMDPS